MRGGGSGSERRFARAGIATNTMAAIIAAARPEPNSPSCTTHDGDRMSSLVARSAASAEEKPARWSKRANGRKGG